MSVSQLLIKIYHLVADHSDIESFQNFVKSQNLIQQLTIIIEHIQHNKIKKDYKELEKQLQKYESEVRVHIRESYLMNQKYDEMKNQIKQLEQDRDELLQNTKKTLNKLKKENEELYQKVKLLKEQLNYYKQIEICTQQSTKISNTKTIEKQNKLKDKRFHTNITPQKTVNSSFDYLVNKRLSQQIVQRKKSVQKYMSSKRKSCATDLSKSM
ncbi:unnamed protein product (macronuclear) [Paramecium tetraurelia]|uniref:Uncharacterized protein n=1 Tax=Paramecium tetraurelia TaxID=5888 RepID=A0BHV0_PARTE|nr:uncharacterized protein GSPATT00029153001 [Paramecium tetraurelia]CAK58117.1 unnamed protein product [Paramecium tetraurelia]|eukprot:XP_001425515.1 hypothetical protein (macronuclear) [Paramecium tetraurelia strain d4-2]